mmetsp:Transcript_19171/g.18512  ORF Transcript_19171/g.18512 Transcript_19171/m.18512 type:complete len:915 (-) Transcript_19171:147-2891(-)
MEGYSKSSVLSKSSSQIQGQRVRVAVRCRPVFNIEVEECGGSFDTIIDTSQIVANLENNHSSLGRIVLTQTSGKPREFLYDYAFGQESSQDDIFEAVAQPVIDDFLSGKHGTIFAYGQTGTGKTYTMGVLEFVSNEHAGIIPRTISRIFDYVDEKMDGGKSVTVTLSFLQLYRETVQDLLAPISAISNGQNKHQSDANEDNLMIREDPEKGFYVEGLNEYQVASYSEAEVLVNLGLENRAIASTLMNATSSRSHTVLTLHVVTEAQRGLQRGSIKSKLMLVDLAGSERVKRSISQGTRLAEAKSINSSLSALGNVIAALAEQENGRGGGHTPYRDSKLTKLLQDSLGGSASTALIATIGPAAVNYSETLSTLQFASRCMSVRGVRVVPYTDTADYEGMCVGLREQVVLLEQQLEIQRKSSLFQANKYETTIKELVYKLKTAERRGKRHPSGKEHNGKESSSSDSELELFDFTKLETIIGHLSSAANSQPQSPISIPSVVTYTESMASSVVPSTSHTVSQSEIVSPVHVRSEPQLRANRDLEKETKHNRTENTKKMERNYDRKGDLHRGDSSGDDDFSSDYSKHINKDTSALNDDRYSVEKELGNKKIENHNGKGAFYNGDRSCENNSIHDLDISLGRGEEVCRMLSEDPLYRIKRTYTPPQQHAIKSPFLEAKTPFLKAKTPFLEAKAPILEPKTPFLEATFQSGRKVPSKPHQPHPRNQLFQASNPAQADKYETTMNELKYKLKTAERSSPTQTAERRGIKDEYGSDLSSDIDDIGMAAKPTHSIGVNNTRAIKEREVIRGTTADHDDESEDIANNRPERTTIIEKSHTKGQIYNGSSSNGDTNMAGDGYMNDDESEASYVVDRIAALTPKQIQRMSPEVRAEVLAIKKALETKDEEYSKRAYKEKRHGQRFQ